MSSKSGDGIMANLKSATRNQPVHRPERPALSETKFSRDQMLERFTAELIAQTGTVYRAHDRKDAERILSEIAAAEKIKKVIVTGKNPCGIEIKSFGHSSSVTVRTLADLKDREALREAAFSADAGITFADFAIAETGTIGMIFDKDQPRLASIAPPVHIAIVPVEKLYPVYEDVITQVFGNAGEIPGQFAFITGPSATADIQAISFKGMHGPMKVIVVFVMGK
jgi:L-lactate dehydrogenase complex protein LldG